MKIPIFLKNLPKVIKNFHNYRPINSVTEIKITHSCNQKCRQCNIHEITTKPVHMSYKNFRRIALKLEDYGCLVGMISGGEPLLNPDLPKILDYSVKLFPLSVSLVSGLYFKRDKIEPIANQCLNKGINLQTSLDALGEKGDYLRGVPNHSETVLRNMEYIANEKAKRNSSSFLYANCVISNQNLDQIPDVIQACKNVGWKSTIGVYHDLTSTAKSDDEMKIRDRDKFLNTVEFLKDNPNILNLNTFIEGLPRIPDENFPPYCPFWEGKRTSTRLTIFENGDLHLCKNDRIGNLLEDNLKNIFESKAYNERMLEYQDCEGCWSSCYTQKHLLFHPKNLRQLIHNIKKILNLKEGAKE